jgi:hypothetical protein
MIAHGAGRAAPRSGPMELCWNVRPSRMPSSAPWWIRHPKWRLSKSGDIHLSLMLHPLAKPHQPDWRRGGDRKDPTSPETLRPARAPAAAPCRSIHPIRWVDRWTRRGLLVSGCGRVRRPRIPLRLKAAAVALAEVYMKSLTGRGWGARRDVAPCSPVPLSRPSGAVPDSAAASGLKAGIFPDPSPPIQVIPTQPLKSNRSSFNCLSFYLSTFSRSTASLKMSSSSAPPSKSMDAVYKLILRPAVISMTFRKVAAASTKLPSS